MKLPFLAALTIGLFCLPAAEAYNPVCNPKAVSEEIHAGKKVARSVLYHYGKKEILLKDVEAHTIPEVDWNEFIMGSKTRFSLKPFRRGLYGTEQLEDADTFGNATYNWLIEIQLKDECLVPQKTATLISVTQSPLFLNWFLSKNLGLQPDTWGKTNLTETGYPHPKYFSAYSSNATETTAEKLIDTYFREHEFAMIQDYAGALVRSWAIRDRNCIADIQGSAAHWSKVFSEREELWVNTCDIYRDHRNNIRVWFTGMAEAGTNENTLITFTEMIRKVAPPEAPLIGAPEAFAAQDFALELLHAYQRCDRLNRVLFNVLLTEIANNVDNLQSSEVKAKLEQTCR